MSEAAATSKREIRSFLVARDPSIDRRFRPRPDRSVRLFGDIEEDEEDSESISSVGDDFGSYALSEDEGDGALVYLRLRPVDKPSSAYTLAESGKVLITGPSNECTSSSNNKNQMEKHYSFSEIFDSEVNQREVFEKCIGRKIESDDNFTVLTYGTSGSGKTFTLLGDDERPGIIPRALENIFTLYAKNIYAQPMIKIIKSKATIIDDIACAKETRLRKQILGNCVDMNTQHVLVQECIQREHSFQPMILQGTSVFIWISFVEIYNELVYDLLEPPTAKVGSTLQQPSNTATLPRKNLKIMANDGKVFIKGLTSVFVKSSLEALKLLRYGLQKVNYASTSINANSSRSHCVFMVDVLRISSNGDVAERSYKFCDLAGSERLNKTGNIGSRLKEAQSINTSLLVLGRCLDSANATTRKKSTEVIPFRESKLTMLLQSALLGKEKLSMIVNVTPTDKYYEENLNVLGFASIAKNIIYRQPVVKQSNSRYSFLTNSKYQTSNLDTEFIELQEENCLLRSEVDDMRRLLEEQKQQFKKELQQQEEDLRIELGEIFEEEQEQREHNLRNELVDSFQMDLEKRKQQYEAQLKNELALMKRTYEAKIESLRRQHDEEIDYLRRVDDDEDSEDSDEGEGSDNKKRRTQE